MSLDVEIGINIRVGNNTVRENASATEVRSYMACCALSALCPKGRRAAL